MSIKQVLTIIGESFAAPNSGSFVVHTNHGNVVLREGGVYDGIDLSGADLAGATLSKIRLRGAKLVGANLSGTNFAGADLTNADLSGSNVSGAQFDGATMENVISAGVLIDRPPTGVAQNFFNAE
jgi:uncharacterized protein YjbI with pentapeptide repeats